MFFAGEAQKTRYFDQKPKYLTENPENTRKMFEILRKFLGIPRDPCGDPCGDPCSPMGPYGISNFGAN